MSLCAFLLIRRRTHVMGTAHPITEKRPAAPPASAHGWCTGFQRYVLAVAHFLLVSNSASSSWSANAFWLQQTIQQPSGPFLNASDSAFDTVNVGNGGGCSKSYSMRSARPARASSASLRAPDRSLTGQPALPPHQEEPPSLLTRSSGEGLAAAAAAPDRGASSAGNEDLPAHPGLR